jgi:hypothetical protein
VTSLDEILRFDAAEPRLSRMQECERERARLVDCLVELNAGMRTFDAVNGQTLSGNDTTEATKARWTARLAVLKMRINGATRNG